LKRVIVLGLVGGVALSTKWVGGLVTVGGLLLVLRLGMSDEGKSWRRAGAAVAAYLAAAMGVFILINLPLVWGLGQFAAGVRYEVSHVTEGHHGLVSPSPVLFYLRALVVEVGPALLGLAVLRVVWLILDKRRRTPGWWLAPVTAGVFFVLVCLPEYARDRYLLPTVVLTAWLGVQGGVMLADGLVRRCGKALSGRASMIVTGVVAAAVLAGAMWTHVSGLPAHLAYFRHDTRDALRAWLVENLPADSKLLYEQWTGVRSWELPFESAAVREVPQFGDMAALRSGGYTHVAISSMACGRYFDPEQVPTAEFEAEYAVRKRMYERLMSGELGKVVFCRESTGPAPEMHSPAVYVIELK
jgi:hypothetical protein